MDYVLVVERLFDKFGVPGIAMGIASWFIWKLIQPIINNVNQSTHTLVEVSKMLSEHNQRAIDMHDTCKEHGGYLCEATELLNNNREKIMIKLGEIHSDVRNMTDNVKKIGENAQKWGD